MNVTCVFLCVCSCPEGAVHHTVAEVVRFVEDRIKGEDDKDSRALRGPYLARLELIHRLRERGCPEESQLGKKHFVFVFLLVLQLHSALTFLCVSEQESL